MTASAFFFALMSVFVNLAGRTAFFQKALFRNLVSMLNASGTLWITKTPVHVPRATALPLAVRTIAGTLAVFCNYYAIDHLAIASSNALLKLSPFFTIIFASIALKEHVSKGELGCIIVALAGSAFLILPNMGTLGFSSLIGLTGGVMTGIVHTSLRAMRKHPDLHGNVIVFLFSSGSFLITLIPCLLLWMPMTGRQVPIMLAAGAACAGAQFALTAAYRYAAPKDISICDSSQIIFSAVFGFLFFHQIPSATNGVGYVLIIAASALLFFLYKRQAAREKESAS